jgi:extracellular factor (EF) 3-hydroxypalmitic acid methyl ester biosynthesis protein
MGLSVVHRKALLRAYIDDAIARKPDARILSVASGHCRELEGSLVESSMFKGEFIALDQDPQSCDEVRWRQHALRANSRVRVVESSVRALLGGRHTDLGPFDLVYSAGLYDYLELVVAQKLTARLGALCSPQGRLLIANFVPDGYSRAYMELFMDWHLIVRDDAAMLDLARHAGPGVCACSATRMTTWCMRSGGGGRLRGCCCLVARKSQASKKSTRFLPSSKLPSHFPLAAIGRRLLC